MVEDSITTSEKTVKLREEMCDRKVERNFQGNMIWLQMTVSNFSTKKCYKVKTFLNVNSLRSQFEFHLGLFIPYYGQASVQSLVILIGTPLCN